MELSVRNILAEILSKLINWKTGIYVMKYLSEDNHDCGSPHIVRMSAT